MYWRRFSFYNIQGFHLGQVPEGSISQFADAVSLQLEDLQAGQTLKGQTLYLTYTVPVQLTAGGTDRQTDKPKKKNSNWSWEKNQWGT